MKKRIWIAALCILFLSACGDAPINDLQVANASTSANADVEALRKEVADLQEKHEVLQEEVNELREALDTLQAALGQSADESSQSGADDAPRNPAFHQIAVTVLGREVNTAGDQITFTIQVENKLEKDIQGLRGELLVSDLFSQNQVSYTMDFVEQPVPAGETITFAERLDYMTISNFHSPVRDNPFNSLRFTFEIERVALTDGTILQ